VSDGQDEAVTFLEDLVQTVSGGIVRVDVTEGAAHEVSVIFRIVGHLDHRAADLLSSSVLHGSHLVSIVKVDCAVGRARNDHVVLLVVDIGAVVETNVGRDFNGTNNRGIERLSLAQELVGKSVDLLGDNLFKCLKGFGVEGGRLISPEGGVLLGALDDLLEANVADVVDSVEKSELDGFESELDFTNESFVGSVAIGGDFSIEEGEHEDKRVVL